MQARWSRESAYQEAKAQDGWEQSDEGARVVVASLRALVADHAAEDTAKSIRAAVVLLRSTLLALDYAAAQGHGSQGKDALAAQLRDLLAQHEARLLALQPSV